MLTDFAKGGLDDLRLVRSRNESLRRLVEVVAVEAAS